MKNNSFIRPYELTSRELIYYEQNALESPSAENSGKKERALREVLEALKEIIDVIQISAQMIENYLLQFAFPELTAKRRGGEGRTPRVNAELARLEDAVRRNDHDAAAVAMKNLKEETAKQVARGREGAKNIRVSNFIEFSRKFRKTYT